MLLGMSSNGLFLCLAHVDFMDGYCNEFSLPFAFILKREVMQIESGSYHSSELFCRKGIPSGREPLNLFVKYAILAILHNAIKLRENQHGFLGSICYLPLNTFQLFLLTR